MQQQLRILRQLSETAIEAESLTGALRSLSSGLGPLLPGEVVGILGLDAEEYVLIVQVRGAVSRAFLDSVQQEMLARYEALSGRRLRNESVRTEIEGLPPTEGGTAEVGSRFTVPIITGGELRGLLVLAAISPNSYSSLDVSFLYHAANHMSTILAALGRMRHLAIRDALTGLYNRMHLEEETQRAWLQSQRYGHAMGIVIVDVDHFKTLNDTYGHMTGDEVLREFARLLMHVARGTDIIGRYGGDEFMVVLPEAELADIKVFSQRLLTRVRNHVFCEKTLKLHLTTSLGMSSSRRFTGPSGLADMIAQADKALYRAKREGRDRMTTLTEEAHPLEELDLSGELPAPPAPEAPAEPAHSRVLIVEDDPTAARIVGSALERQGCEVDTVGTADEAVAAVRADPARYHVVLIDLRLPGKGGMELLEELREIDNGPVRIVVTGYASVDNAVESLRRGAYDFIVKPVLPEQISSAVKRALDFRRLTLENLRYQFHLEEMVRQKNTELLDSLSQIRHSYRFTLEALVGMLDARESGSGRHSMRVRDLALALGRNAGLSEKDLRVLANGALLHDIGKIGIPDAILLKAGPLSPEEWQVMKTHSEIGYRLLRSSPYLAEAAEIVYASHERFNGAGYPRGIGGDRIAIGARIFAVVDAYDAMRSDRPYSRSISSEDAVREILANSGTQFDPAIVRAFIDCREEIERIHLAASSEDAHVPE